MATGIHWHTSIGNRRNQSMNSTIKDLRNISLKKLTLLFSLCQSSPILYENAELEYQIYRYSLQCFQILHEPLDNECVENSKGSC